MVKVLAFILGKVKDIYKSVNNKSFESFIFFDDEEKDKLENSPYKLEQYDEVYIE